MLSTSTVILLAKLAKIIAQCSTNADFDNITEYVTFDVGESEACFNFSFADSKTRNTEQFRLLLVSSSNKTEVDEDSKYVVINIVGQESRKLFICRQSQTNSMPIIILA